MTNDRMTNEAERPLIEIRHSSFGNSSFILHRFDFDPFFVFAACEEAAGGEFAGDILAEDRAIAGRSERAIEEPLVFARLSAVADRDFARHDFQVLADGETSPRALLFGALAVEIDY